MRTTLLTLAAFAGLVPTLSAQAYDILIPTGSNDGAFALVDKDRDGKYTTPGEAWDWLLYDRDTSPKYCILLNGRVYIPDSVLDAIVSVQDTNKNGIVEASERRVFYDFAANLGASNPNMTAMDGAGWMWSAVNTGAAEGIYKHKDLNNDDDAEDPGETIPVLTELMTNVGIHNTPNTSGAPPVYPVLALTGIDYIMYDPTWGNGRFIVEDEATDQTLALEDKNNDGDFHDPGECYLFAALYNGGSLQKDLNPDVGNNLLPSANEIRGVVVDIPRKHYYLMSSDTTAVNTDAAVIFRGIDRNQDGDVNDPGEVNIFWDGSLDSPGATKGYNFIVGMEIDLAGQVFVNAEWDAARDTERLLRLNDNNGDGDANDPGETTVLWELASDRTHYRPALLPSGTLSVISGKTTQSEIDYYGAATCPSSLLPGPSFHNIQYGTPSSGGASKAPILGNQNWTVRTWGAAAAAQGAYGIGLQKFAAGVPLDGGGNCKVFNSLDAITFFFTTSAAGDFDMRLPIPNQTALLGVWTYWQSLVVDPTSPAGLGITLSDGMEVKFGDYSYTK